MSAADNPNAVTVDLDRWAADVDRYATKHGLSREAAVLALVRTALTNPVKNSITGSVDGTVVQAGDVHGGVNL